jgi:hypothetical protein
MNYRNTILLIVIMILIVAAYILADSGVATVDTPIQTEPAAEETKIVYCDTEGNTYDTAQEAQATGLAAAEYGTTLCPGYVAAATGDYRGLTISQAAEIAELRSESFRVVEIDGEPQPTTKDIRDGRINATVVDGVITSYFKESAEPTQSEKVEVETAENGPHDIILQMTRSEAEDYAKENDLLFRVGSLNGEPQALTMDYRPGRITADVEDDIVTNYSVE